MRKISKNIFLLALMFIVIGVSISIYNITFATEEKSNDKETGLDAVNNSENKLVGGLEWSGWQEEKTYWHRGRLTAATEAESEGYKGRGDIATILTNCSNGNAYTYLLNDGSIYCLRKGNSLSNASGQSYSIFFNKSNKDDNYKGNLKKLSTPFKNWGTSDSWGSDKTSTSLFTYAATFSQKYMDKFRDGNYYNERSQYAIWQEVNKGAPNKPTTKESLQDSWLYHAAKAIEVYEEAYSDDKVSYANIDSAQTELVNYKGQECYKIGPFTMSNYEYIYSSFAEYYSGNELTSNKNLVGGILGMNLVLIDDDNKTVKTQAINNDKQISGGYEIVYKNTGKDAPTNTDNISGYNITTNPSNASYKYPRPNAQFYIYVKSSQIDNAVNAKLQFTYRRTITDGKGWVIHNGNDGYQPLLVVNYARVMVQKGTNTSDPIRLTTNVKIDKYITKVEDKDSNLVRDYANTRQNKAMSEKSGNPVETEKGDYVTFKIVLTNSEKATVKVAMKDILDNKTGIITNVYDEDNKKTLTEKENYVLEVPGKSGNTNGTRTLTVRVKVERNTGTGKNTAQLLKSYNGRYYPTYNNKLVVNRATRVKDEDYLNVPDHSVTVKKGISKVSHIKESDGKREGFDRLSKTEDYKKENPIYVEYGDRITYTIELSNTSNTNEKRDVYADFIDDLPIGYSDLTVQVSNNTGTINSIDNTDLVTRTGKAGVTIGDATKGKTNSHLGAILDFIKNNSKDSEQLTGDAEESIIYNNNNTVSENIVTDGDFAGEDHYTNTTEETGTNTVNLYNTVNENTITDENIVNDDGANATIEEYEIDPNKDHQIKIDQIKVPEGQKVTVTVSFVIENKDTSKDYENKARITSIYNANRIKIPNKTEETESKDYYRINDYKASINKYISSYNEIDSKDNNNLGITAELNHVDELNRENYTEEDKVNYPLATDKTDELIYSIKVTNDAVDEGNGKYATSVRPTTIEDTIQNGLEIKDKEVFAKVFKSTGEVKKTIDKVSAKKKLQGGDSLNKESKYTLQINDNVILDPGEYIIYYVPVKVTESNMYLYSLKNTAEISELTNINHYPDMNSNRFVTDLNKSEKTTSSEFVRMKDLVISGYVWLDTDKDGYMAKDPTAEDADGNRGFTSSINAENNPTDDSTEEKAMENIVVRLFRKDPDTNKIENIRTVKTNNKGLYTFAFVDDSNSDFRDGNYLISNDAEGHPTKATDSDQRILKATNKDINNTQKYSSDSKLYEYYIEFEYDGMMYKSTVYSEDTNLNDDGSMKTLNKDDGTTDVPYKRDSNAAEFKTNRDTFDSSHEIVGYNYAADGTNTNKINLEYQKDGHNSYLRYDKTRIVTARSFIDKDKIDTALDDASKLSGTKLLWLFKQNGTYNKPETDYLKFINLGLEERESVDISVVQDIYEVRNIINGEEMTYWYNQNKFAKDDSNVDHDASINDAFESQFYMTRKKEDAEKDNVALNPYEFKYYLADYNYKLEQYSIDEVKNYKTIDSELNSEISFRIKVTNNPITNDEPNKENKDIKVYTGINEIVEYFDNEFMKIEYNADKTVKTINVKTKDSNGYLIDTPLKIADAYFVCPNGQKIPATMEGYNTSNDVLTLSNTSLYNSTNTVSGYNTVYIRPNVNAMDKVMLAEGENVDIIIKFIVAKDKSSRNLELGLKTAIAEISAYSTYYKDEAGNYYAAGLIDKDSNPNNFGLTYKEYPEVAFDSSKNNKANDPYLALYEDDTYKTGINLLTQEDNERSITGQVWDDARSDIAKDKDNTYAKDSKQYIGDGKNDSSKSGDLITSDNPVKINKALGNKEKKDNTVGDVGVKLVETVRIPVYEGSNIKEERTYEETIKANNNNDSVVSTRTKDGNGTYELKGYIPGEYIVEFTYGDKYDGKISSQMQIFNGQDYKSTTYQKYDGMKDAKENPITCYADEAYVEDSGPEAHDAFGTLKKDTDKVLAILETKGLSDAKDDEVRRLETITYSETLNNNKTMILRGINSINRELQSEHETMFADTAEFLVRAEKEDRATEVLTYQQTMNKFKTNKERHPIENIDFGLQYRPEQQVDLNKYVKNLTITTSDEKVDEKECLVDAKFNEYYGVVTKTDKETGVTEFLTYDTEDQTGVVLKVNKNASKKEVDDLITSVKNNGGTFRNESEMKTNKNGTKYQIIIAGTELDKENSVGLSNLQFVANDKDAHAKDSTQGFLYLNIDDEIMQGAEINVEYLYTGNNISEIDRVSKALSKLKLKASRNNGTATTSGLEILDATTTDTNETVGAVLDIAGLSARPDVDKFRDIAPYSGAATARNMLFDKYYRYVDNGGHEVDSTDSYQKPATYRIRNKEVGERKMGINEYYGKYLGTTYYSGTIDEAGETVSELRVDKILDYVDNNMVFKAGDNKEDQNYQWRTTSSSELVLGGFICPEILKFAKVDNNILMNSITKYVGVDEITNKFTEDDIYEIKAAIAGLIQQYSNKAKLVGEIGDLSIDQEIVNKFLTGRMGINEIDPAVYLKLLNQGLLIDSEDVAYDSETRSNLALMESKRETTNDNVAGSENIVDFLYPRDLSANDSFAKANIVTSKIVSAEDDTENMIYENVGEIVEYSSVTGRVTNLSTTLGNVDLTGESTDKGSSEYVQSGKKESDTAAVEKITLTPPTGLNKTEKMIKKAVTGISFVGIIGVIVLVAIFGTLGGIKLYRNRKIK